MNSCKGKALQLGVVGGSLGSPSRSAEGESEKLLPFLTWQASLISNAFYLKNLWLINLQNSST